MANLGNLFYTLGIKDMTDADIERINQKLANIGSNIQINPESFRRQIEAALAAPVNITFTPNITGKDVEDKLKGQVINAEITPLASNVLTQLNNALAASPLQLTSFTIPPESVSTAVQTALTNAGFTGVGDLVAKDIKTKLVSETITANVVVNQTRLSDSIVKVIEKIEQREVKLKIDKAEIKKMVEDALTKVKITFDPIINQQDIDAKFQGKVFRAEILPLASKLKQGIKDAVKDSNGNGVEVLIAPMATKLRDLVTRVLTQQGFMINIDTVTGLSAAIKRITQGTNHVTLTVDPTALARSLQASLANLQSKTFGLVVSRQILLDSIDNALAGKKFNIQIAVMHDQARRAVQNALNNARMVGKDDALAYQRLMTGEYKAAQAELTRLRAEQRSAANAANLHASASLNIGSAWGSNIRIAGELGSAMASLYSLQTLKNFLQKVIEVGGELEHQKIALETIYGSASKMETLYSQIKGLARTSPFGVMDLTKNIKQLSAYGVEYNEVYDTAKRLADISAATSVDMNRLILAFGKTKNRTFLDGLEAKQFAYANIPIYDALSKKLTELEGKFVSVKDVMKRISKREIGFDMVKEILWDMTDEGGKFYNMQEKLAGSVKTSWKLVADNIQLMFGEIAESGVGDFLKGLGEVLQKATREWKKWFSVIGAGGVILGAYKMSTLMLSKTISTQTASVFKQALAEKQHDAAVIRRRGLIQGLTANQRQLIAASKQLDAADLQRLIRSRRLHATEIREAYVSGLIKKAVLDEALAKGVLNKRNYDLIVSNGELTGVMMRAQAGFRAFRQGIMSGLGMVFNWTTAIFAAIAGITYLIQHNLRENEIAEGFGKSFEQKGEDMAKNISDALAKPFENLSELAGSQLVDEYKSLIKDFATLPDDMITRAIYDEDGKIKSTKDQIAALREELETLRDVANEMKGDTSVIINATGDGWFKEDAITNLKDYQSDFKNANASYLKFATQNKDLTEQIIESAKQSDSAYAEEIKNAKSLSEQLAILIRRRGEFKDAFDAAMGEGSFFGTSLRGGFMKLNALWSNTPIKAMQFESISKNTVFEDIRNVTSMLKESHSDWDFNNLTAVQIEYVRQFFDEVIKKAEITDKEVKRHLADMFQVYIPVNLIPSEVGDAWIKNAKERFGNCATEGYKEAVKILKLDGWDALSQTQKDMVKSMMDDATDQTRKQLPGMWDEIQSWMSGHQLQWFVNLVLGKTGNSNLSQTANDAVNNVGGWDNISDTTKEIVQNNDSDNITASEFRKKLKDGFKKAEQTLKDAEKYGKTSETYKKAKEEYDKWNTAVNELKWGDLKKDSKRSGGSQKDEYAEQLRSRFKDIKDAWAEVQKWAKTEGKQAAFSRVGESGLFSTLAADQIPQTTEDYKALVEGIKAELQKAGVKGTARENLLNDLLKTLLDLDKTVVDEQLKTALDKVSEEAARQLENWNLYDKLRKATGNENMAISIAFGMEGGETDYVAMVKKQFDDVAKLYDGYKDKTFDTTDESSLKDAPEELKKTWQHINDEIAKYHKQERDEMVEMVSQYRNTQEELIAMTAEAEEKKRKIRESKGLSEAKKKQMTAQIDADLDYKKFQKSGQYLNFFNAILSMTKREAESVGKKIKKALDDKLKAGVITAEEYCREIDKIDKKLEEIRSKQKGFGGFGSFMNGGLESLFKDKYAKAESDYNKAVQDYSDAKSQFDLFLQEGNEAGMRQAQSDMDAASSMKEDAAAAMDSAQSCMQVVAVIDKIVHGINDTVQGIKGACELITEMADSYGADTSADTDWGAANAFLSTFGEASQHATDAWDSLKSGNIGGVIKGVVGSITSWFTGFNRWHDAKLQKQIERSKEIVDNIQYAYDALERRMSNHLGNKTDLFFDKEKMESEISSINNQLARLYEKKAKYEGRKKSDVWLGSAGALAGGMIGGPIGAFAGGLAGTITTLVNRSKLKKTEKEINNLVMERERIMHRINAYEEGGALNLQRQMMKEQLAELEKQRSLEEGKKNKDEKAIKEYEDQIDELSVKIQQFAEDAAKDVYGIDLQGWASQIGDALIDAFAAGEDAAKAFDKTVSSIMRNLVGQMLIQDLIAPMFEDLREYLFGENGVYSKGIDGGDFKLSEQDAIELAERLKSMQGVVEDAKSIYDQINEATGGMLDDKDSKNGLTAGIQGVTEDTADLLASYLNAIRADVSLQTNDYWRSLLNESLPQISVIAESQLRVQEAIADNTLRTADAAELIVKSNQAIHDTLRRSVQGIDKFSVK